jgi:plastocyanin
MFDITKYFRRGQNQTIEFRNGTNLSYAGPTYTLVESGTELDRWYVGSYFGVEYTIACDVNSERKEIIKCLCTATTSKANIVVYGRSNLGDDLMQLEVEVTDAYFKLVAYPRVQDDSTAIQGAKIIFSANYYSTLNEPTPTLLGSAVSAFAPTYTLSPSTTSTAEAGQTVSIRLITTNVLAGTVVPYAITGVQSADIGGALLTGNFVVGTTDVISFPITADLTTEGVETLVMSLTNSGATTSITIADSSTSPAQSLTLTTDKTSVNEGGTFTITLTTGNIADATEVDYEITGVTSEDINGVSLTGTFVVGQDMVRNFIVSEDVTTEGTEQFQISLSQYPDVVASVTIGDTSLSPIVPSYSLSTSASPANEGSTITITLVTANVAIGSVLPWTITGIDTADIGGASLTGAFNVGSDESINLTITADATTEGTETMTFALDGGQASINIPINDTSTTPGAGYSFSVSNTYSSAYTMVGTDETGSITGSNPTITCSVGDTLTFNVAAPGHPFFIKTVNSTGTSNQVTTPTANNQGTDSGTVTWTPDTPGTYHYNCQFHSVMHGLIVVN